ncbi:hypothetical protein OESDEN_06949 [Oesophagostomum dentatum]|uniref:DUF4440 domain-containing protein n=1 Tax=Oesophagostomum dentatum TaxID=61180 RepID=A0A0B1TBI3_OESDE|nr:hypothetical protein OESDEN_06949 [Oesophagostomum dentatum]
MLMDINEFAGKVDTKILGDSYMMTGDFIIMISDYEWQTEKAGLLKGHFTQIWRKANDRYLILYEQFTMV